MTIQTDVVIVGAGPCGLFQIFELGLLGLKAHIVDALPKPGGQCTELYPDKPIYDIPAIPVCDAQDLVARLMKQIEPFGATFHLDQQVSEVQKHEDGTFTVSTSAGTQIRCKAVVIAGGVGSFQPMPLRVDGVDDLVDRQVFYRVKDPRAIPRQGSGRARRRRLGVRLGARTRAAREVDDADSPQRQIPRGARVGCEDGATRGVGKDEVRGRQRRAVRTATEHRLKQIEVRAPDESLSLVPLDHLLVFFGLSPKLGPIAEWGLDLDKNQITTDTEKFESNVPGIYAVGDIATYPGKKKLILSGFHEAALAAFAIKARIEPDKKVHLQYTTTSPIMHQRLGVKD